MKEKKKRMTDRSRVSSVGKLLLFLLLLPSSREKFSCRNQVLKLRRSDSKKSVSKEKAQNRKKNFDVESESISGCQAQTIAPPARQSAMRGLQRLILAKKTLVRSHDCEDKCKAGT